MTTSKKNASGTLRSALRYSLFFLFSFTATAAPRGDRFLFRVADQVVAGDDLAQAGEDLTALDCRFPDSLLADYLGKGLAPKLREEAVALAKLEGPLKAHPPRTIFLGTLRRYWKLLTYVEGQEVEIAPALEKELANVPGCPSIIDGDNKVRASFRRWLRTEIYLRSRYARAGVAGTNPEKRRESIELFVDSLDKQLGHEDFW